MKNYSQHRLAEEAARFMAEGLESEYLHAKERAMLMLGLSSQHRLPSNRKIKDHIARLTKAELGKPEVERRVREMRQIAAEIMLVIDEFDPHLIGSVLSGKIRATSDIDLHAYCDDFQILQKHLQDYGYEDVEAEEVQNRKGHFIHLKWIEKNYPVEITVYPWSERDVVPMSSITNAPMKRADLRAVKALGEK